jgi:hypothetical protein
MTRKEHLQRCKDRAMEYVERGDLLNAVTSMASDLEKHPETKTQSGGALQMLSVMAAMQAQQGDRQAVIRFIEGFN